MQALEDSAGTLFAAIFALLGRLEEIESKVRLLQLVSICVEVLGEAAQPHLGAVAAALPQVRPHTRPFPAVSGNPLLSMRLIERLMCSSNECGPLIQYANAS